MEMKGVKQVTMEESKNLIELIESRLIKNYDMAIDGGAHAGTWTVIMAKHFHAVHSFEPHPQSFEYLKENCKDTSFDNVFLHNSALMDRGCKIDVYAPGRTTLTATQVRYNLQNGEHKAVSIDSFGFETCGLLKLDVEGAEYHAIRGAVETIKRCKPFILVELNGLGKRFGIRDGETAQLIKGMGYKEVWAKGCDRGYTHV